jgi:hypothetical protein
VLKHTPHRFGLDAAWYEARQLAPEDLDAQAELVRGGVLELFDEGLVVGSYATERESYRAELHEFLPADREALEREIAASTRPATMFSDWKPRPRPFWRRLRFFEADADDTTSLYLVPTEPGRRLLGLPPAGSEATAKRIVRDHPEFIAELERYLREMDEWAETGEGMKPEPPEWPV